jgi:formimidoylglutamate deiminase
MIYHFEKLLMEDDWYTNVLIETDALGKITAVAPNANPSTADEVIKGATIPGFQNAHSHAFQYAMAGLAEVHDPSHRSDNFWSWRKAMYDLALSISPDDLESIATMLYAEMLNHGYTNVAEFHYVHHQQDGTQYENLSEMGERLVKAAKRVGLGITLVPIFYQKGGFGQEPQEGQRRFISSDADKYYELLEASKRSAQMYENANVGIGIHSMRGVDPLTIKEVAQNGPQDLPFHIHISEQLKEVEDSIAYLGKRPVEWLAENVELSDRFHLVHATHLTQDETESIARSGANVVICPTTEGNLGDGLFPLNEFNGLNGKWSIGTDSHVSLNPLEELRLLDYGQRLISHSRLTFAGETGDSGRTAIAAALISGRKAMNNYTQEFFSVGQPLNAVSYSLEHPLLATASDKLMASSILYATDARANTCTISHGKVVSKNGVHLEENSIKDAFIATMKKLGSRS